MIDETTEIMDKNGLECLSQSLFTELNAANIIESSLYQNFVSNEDRAAYIWSKIPSGSDELLGYLDKHISDSLEEVDSIIETIMAILDECKRIRNKCLSPEECE